MSSARQFSLVLALVAAVPMPLASQASRDSITLSLADAIGQARLHNATFRQTANNAGAAAWTIELLDGWIAKPQSTSTGVIA